MELFSGEAFRFEKEDNLGIVTFDLKGERVNKFSPIPFQDLEKILQLVPGSGIEALLIRSAKALSFVVGADIRLIQNLKDREDALQATQEGQRIFSMIEDLPIPTIAAIEGPCMGGGTEMVLACDYRLVSDHPKTVIALPEVKLGVLPGWGGTYRLPKTIGLINSLDYILSGKNCFAPKAQKLGLANMLIPHVIFNERCVDIAKALASGKSVSGLSYPKADIKEKLLASNFIGRKIVFKQARDGVMRQSRGHYPAPLKILNVLEKNWGKSREKYLKSESKAFAELWATPESKNLVNLFFLVEDGKKDSGTDLSAEAIKALPTVSELAVLGAGVMGGGIAALAAKSGIRTTVKDINHQALAKAFSHARSLFNKQVKQRRMKPHELEEKMGRIRGQVDYRSFKGVDLVVEAIVENIDIKKKVFTELEAEVRPDTIIATNTSSLPLGQMATAFKDPSRFIGIHFFNPVDKMPLIEVITHPQSDPKVVARAVSFSRALGKTPVVVKDGPGFLVNRLLMPWLNESGYLLREGFRIKKLDKIAKDFGMPMGPCELLDEIGIDVAAKVGHILNKEFGARAEAADASDLMAGSPEVNGRKRLGRKSGLGFYKWDKPAGRRLEVDQEAVDQILFSGKVPNTPEHTSEAIVRRMFYPMINEAAMALKEGIVEGARQVDLAMIFGTGFPPFRGGLCRWADDVGLDKVVAELERLGAIYGERLKPSEALREFAKNSGHFY